MRLAASVAMLVVGFNLSTAQAEDHNAGFYIELGYGVSRLDSTDGFSVETGGRREELRASFRNGDAAAIAFGYAGESFRLGLEYMRLENDIKPPASHQSGSDDITGELVSLSLWHRFGPRWKITPYLGGGIGYLEVESDQAKDSDSYFLFGGGIEFPIFHRLHIDLSHRFYKSRRLTLNHDNNEFSINYEGTATLLKVRYFFGS